jgi:hypothetical protein
MASMSNNASFRQNTTPSVFLNNALTNNLPSGIHSHYQSQKVVGPDSYSHGKPVWTPPMPGREYIEKSLAKKIVIQFGKKNSHLLLAAAILSGGYLFRKNLRFTAVSTPVRNITQHSSWLRLITYSLIGLGSIATLAFASIIKKGAQNEVEKETKKIVQTEIEKTEAKKSKIETHQPLALESSSSLEVLTPDPLKFSSSSKIFTPDLQAVLSKLPEKPHITYNKVKRSEIQSKFNNQEGKHVKKKQVCHYKERSNYKKIPDGFLFSANGSGPECKIDIVKVNLGEDSRLRENIDFICNFINQHNLNDIQKWVIIHRHVRNTFNVKMDDFKEIIDPLPRYTLNPLGLYIEYGLGACRHQTVLAKLIADRLGLKSTFWTFPNHVLNLAKVDRETYPFDMTVPLELWYGSKYRLESVQHLI